MCKVKCAMYLSNVFHYVWMYRLSDTEKMSVEVLLEGVTPTIGEGPHWDDKTQSLLFVDILTATVYRWDSNTDTLESRKLGK